LERFRVESVSVQDEFAGFHPTGEERCGRIVRGNEKEIGLTVLLLFLREHTR
jgi:hypothetical protein